MSLFSKLLPKAGDVFVLPLDAGDLPSRSKSLIFQDYLVESMLYSSSMVTSQQEEQQFEQVVSLFEGMRDKLFRFFLPFVEMGQVVYWEGENVTITYKVVDVANKSTAMDLALNQGALYQGKGVQAKASFPPAILHEFERLSTSSKVSICMMTWAKNIWNRLTIRTDFSFDYISSVVSLRVTNYKTADLIRAPFDAKFTLELPVRGWSPFFVETLDTTNQRYIDENRFGCGAFQFSDKSWQNTYCSMQTIVNFKCICLCQITGDIGSQFFQSGKSVAEGSNYNVFTQPEAIADVNVAEWSGFWFTLAFLVSYVCMVGYIVYLDNKTFSKLTWDEKLADYQKIGDRKLEKRRKKKQRTILMNAKKLEVESGHNPNEHKVTQKEIVAEVGTLDESVNHDNQVIKYKYVSQVTPEETSVIEKPQKGRKSFCRYFLGHVISHHALLYPFGVVNYGSPRHVRVSLLFLTALLQICCCALFYNMEEGGADDTSVVNQIWIALYSALIVSVLMYIVCIMFVIPSKILEKTFDESTELSNEELVKRLDKLLWRKYTIAYVVYGLAAMCFFYYILVFTAVYSKETNVKVIASWIGSFVIDMGLLEFVPGLIVSLLFVIEMSTSQNSSSKCYLFVTKFRKRVEKSKRFRKLFV